MDFDLSKSLGRDCVVMVLVDGQRVAGVQTSVTSKFGFFAVVVSGQYSVARRASFVWHGHRGVTAGMVMA